MKSYWVPSVDNLGIHRCWTFAEFITVSKMERLFGELLVGSAAIGTTKAA